MNEWETAAVYCFQVTARILTWWLNCVACCQFVTG